MSHDQGVSVQVSVWHVSIQGGLYPRGLYPEGLSVPGVSVEGGLCRGGLCSGEVSVQGGPLSGEGLCMGGLCLGDLCQGNPLDRVSIISLHTVMSGQYASYRNTLLYYIVFDINTVLSHEISSENLLIYLSCFYFW